MYRSRYLTWWNTAWGQTQSALRAVSAPWTAVVTRMAGILWTAKVPNVPFAASGSQAGPKMEGRPQENQHPMVNPMFNHHVPLANLPFWIILAYFGPPVLDEHLWPGETLMFPVGIVLVFELVNRARVKCGHGSKCWSFILNRVVGLIRINHPKLFLEKGPMMTVTFQHRLRI